MFLIMPNTCFNVSVVYTIYVRDSAVFTTIEVLMFAALSMSAFVPL